MATVYADAPDLRVEAGLAPDDEAGLPTAAADALITDAERRVDRLVGPAPRRADTGRKYAPLELGETYAGALREATVILADAKRRNPAAFDPPAAKSIAGPDFTLSDVAGAPPAGAAALRAAAATLRDAGLIITTARGVA